MRDTRRKRGGEGPAGRHRVEERTGERTAGAPMRVATEERVTKRMRAVPRELALKARCGPPSDGGTGRPDEGFEQKPKMAGKHRRAGATQEGVVCARRSVRQRVGEGFSDSAGVRAADRLRGRQRAALRGKIALFEMDQSYGLECGF
ncbi:hypothetical protein ERJ75_000229700 [Trypanosoma vivax]|nr:hypothetical protein ERJ75_000229700 [Trypanosoma vivax]